jgi:uncharacterized membrane protein
MTTARSRLAAIALIACAFLLSALLYPQLPARMATHWDAQGHVNGHSPRAVGALIMPCMMALIALAMQLAPYISPKGFRVDGFARPLGTIVLLILSFLLVMHGAMLLVASGHPLDIGKVAFMGIGVLLIGMGNLLGKTTKNFFLGIRTPWTLASDEVWLRTHRLGGKLFVLAGLIASVAAPFGFGAYALPVVILIAAIVPAAYSYFLYRKLEGFKPPSEGHDVR